MSWELIGQQAIAGGELGAPSGADADLDLIARLERTANAAKARGIPENQVVSSAGAVGRYQIMPTTAQQYGFDPKRLNDANYNERVARAILADLAKQFPGDVEAQAIAYHSGPGAARKYLTRNRNERVLGPQGRDYLARTREYTSGSGGMGGPLTTEPPADAWQLTDQRPMGAPASTKWELAEPDRASAARPVNARLANSPGGAFVRGLAQGVTFNTADEIDAALRSTIGGEDAYFNLLPGERGKTWGERYDRNVEHNREQDRANDALNPVMSGTGQFTGAVLPAIATRGAAMPATITGRIGAGTAFGTASGMASGFGAGEGLENRAHGAGEGGIFGGFLGALLPSVAGVAGRVLQRPLLNARTFADRYARRALERDNVTLGEARTALQRPGMSIGDLGQGAMTEAGEQAALTGEGRAMAAALWGARQRGAEGRISRAVLDNVSNRDMYGVMDTLAAQRAATAKPLYEAAYNTPYRRTDALVDLSRRPAIGAAVKSAINRVANDPDVDPRDVRRAMESLFGKNVEELSDAQIASRLTQAMGTRDIEFRVLDYIKRGLDDVVSQPGASSEIRKLRNAWRAELDNVNPQYREARSAWAGPSRMLEAIEEGRTFMRQDPEAIRRTLDAMGDSEREAYRIGVARALNDMTTNGPRGPMNASRAISENTIMGQRLTSIMGNDPAAIQRLVHHADDLIRQTARGNAILGGSRTAGRAEGAREFEEFQPLLDELVAGARSGITGIAVSARQYVGRWASRAAMDRIRGMSRSRRAELARLLFSPNRQENLAAIDRIFSTPARAPVLGYRRPVVSTGVSGYIGTQRGEAQTTQ